MNTSQPALGGANCAAELPDRVRFEEFAQRLKDCDIRRVEDAIAILPTAHKTNFVLMHSSRSLQSSSFEYPRAILFGNDAKFVVAFNGHEAQKKFLSLEVMLYKDQEKVFEFREILFGLRPPEANKNSATPRYASLNTSLHISEANPKICLTCHKPSGRPLWDSFPLWPSAYGSEGDTLRPGQGYEYDQYQKYLKIRQAHPRYRHLSAHLTQHANFRFGLLLGQLNSKSIAHALLKNPALRPYRFAISGALLCSGREPLENFLPKGHAVLPLQSLLEDTRRFQRESHKLKFDQLKELISPAPVTNLVKTLENKLRDDPYFTNEDTESLARLRSLIEPLGVDMRLWTLRLGRRFFDFNDGRYGLQNLASHLLTTENLNWPQDLSLLCSKLKSLSLQEFNDLRLFRQMGSPTR